jgi:hypothetical protein
MIQKKIFWYSMMAGSMLLYISFLVGGYLLNMPCTGWALFLGLFFLHLSEVRIAMEVGKPKDIPPLTIVIKTILFGFTWWLPLRMGIMDH